MSQATTLEVPGASNGFEGNWGGYSKGMVYAPSGFPVDTAGTAPEATTFAIRDGKVVIEFDVNGDPGSNVVGTPKAWAPSPFEVVLRLEMATFQYHRVEISRYKLIGSDRMSYMTNAHVYDVHSGDLVASERRKANFKKLEGETGELWNKARAKWEAQHHTVDLGSFESPTEKGSQ